MDNYKLLKKNILNVTAITLLQEEMQSFGCVDTAIEEIKQMMVDRIKESDSQTNKTNKSLDDCLNSVLDIFLFASKEYLEGKVIGKRNEYDTIKNTNFLRILVCVISKLLSEKRFRNQKKMNRGVS